MHIVAGAIGQAHFARRVAKARELEVELAGEGGVRLDRIEADAEDLDSLFFELLEAVAEPATLGGSARSIGLGVEPEENRAAAIVGQTHGAAGVVLNLEVVMLISSSREDTCSARHVARVVTKGIEIPYEFLREIVRNAKVDRNTPFEHAFRRLNRYGEEMLREAYPHFVKRCRAPGILPVYAHTPNVKATLRPRDPEKDARILNFAKQAGFLVLDVSDAYEGEDTALLQVAPWDWHPSVLGHKLVADRLYEAFRQREQSLGLELAHRR